MENVNKQLLDALKGLLEFHDNPAPFSGKTGEERMFALENQAAKRNALIYSARQAIAAAEQKWSSNCIAQDRCKQMLELANEITSSASPEEDKLLEVAYAIARYLKLDWPSAYDVDYAFKRIDEALTGMAITVEEEQVFEHLRAMLAAAMEQPK